MIELRIKTSGNWNLKLEVEHTRDSKELFME